MSFLKQSGEAIMRPFTFLGGVASGLLSEEISFKRKGPNVAALMETIGFMESRGEKEPYKFSQPSGKKELGDAVGKYQITEAKLKEQGKKLFNREITKDEFLESPKLQDTFIKRLIKDRFIGEFDFNEKNIFAAHRGGFSDIMKINETAETYKPYVDKALEYYNKINKD